MNTKTLARLAAAAFLAAVLAVLAGCTSHGSDASAAKSAAASLSADPQVQQARALVKHCFAGTPVQQVKQVHLVFLSSSTGKNGPAVVAARTKLGTCLGISKADEQPFINDAITAAEHAHLTAKAGRAAYFGDTLPHLVLKHSNASPVPSASASGSAA